MSCFWGHQWGKWEQFMRDFDWVTLKGPNAGARYPATEPWQRRTCERCGKVDQEALR